MTNALLRTAELWSTVGVSTADGGILAHLFLSQIAISVAQLLHITMVVAVRKSPLGDRESSLLYGRLTWEDDRLDRLR